MPLSPTDRTPDALRLDTPDLTGGQPLYFSGEDALKLTALNSAAGVTLTLTGRFLPATEGVIRPFRTPLVPTTARAASSVVNPFGEGWLLEASVLATAGTPLVGQCFAILSIVRGLTSIGLDVSTLAAGYVTSTQRLAWPWSGITSSLAGGGALRSITGTQPGAGLEISEACPTGARWTLLAFEADLVTSSAAANRVPQLTIDDGANVYARVSVNQNETASHTWRNSFQAGVPQIANAAGFIISTPIGAALQLGAGHRLRTVTAAIDVGDQWNAPQYLVLESIEGS